MITQNTIICRCEDITYGEIVEAIDMGMTSLVEIKRYLRTGMGPCQGRTCGRLILQILSQKTGIYPEKMQIPSVRPPLKSVPMKILAGEKE